MYQIRKVSEPLVLHGGIKYIYLPIFSDSDGHKHIGFTFQEKFLRFFEQTSLTSISLLRFGSNTLWLTFGDHGFFSIKYTPKRKYHLARARTAHYIFPAGSLRAMAVNWGALPCHPLPHREAHRSEGFLSDRSWHKMALIFSSPSSKPAPSFPSKSQSHRYIST